MYPLLILQMIYCGFMLREPVTAGTSYHLRKRFPVHVPLLNPMTLHQEQRATRIVGAQTRSILEVVGLPLNILDNRTSVPNYQFHPGHSPWISFSTHQRPGRISL